MLSLWFHSVFLGQKCFYNEQFCVCCLSLTCSALTQKPIKTRTPNQQLLQHYRVFSSVNLRIRRFAGGMFILFAFIRFRVSTNRTCYCSQRPNDINKRREGTEQDCYWECHDPCSALLGVFKKQGFHSKHIQFWFMEWLPNIRFILNRHSWGWEPLRS